MKTKPNDNACPADAHGRPGDVSTKRYVRDKQVDKHHVQMIRADHGGSLRTFNGGLAHINGWYPSRKAARVLHYEGEAQFHFVERCEVEFSVVRMGTESVRFEFVRNGKRQHYTADVELVFADGSITLVEIKRDEDDLSDPEYVAKLGLVREFCQDLGMRFRVMFKHEIWQSLTHRRNVALFCSRRFATVRPEHLERLERHAAEVGDDATYGSLAAVLEPACARSGEAVVQALTVARRVEIDLTRYLLDATPVTIH